MLKTDVNNRNETAVTDERLGQERAQLVEMTRASRPPPILPSRPPSPRLGPLLSLAVALGGQLGTQRSKLHWGGAALGVVLAREVRARSLLRKEGKGRASQSSL